MNPFEVNGPVAPSGAAVAFQARANTALDDLKVPGNLEKMVDSPFGKIPGSQFIMLPFADMVVHK